MTINAEDFTISTGVDTVHADARLDVNGGVMQVIESYEGIESAVITINAGELSIVSSDDSVNVAAGNDGSGTNLAMGARRGQMVGPGLDRGKHTLTVRGSLADLMPLEFHILEILMLAGGRVVSRADLITAWVIWNERTAYSAEMSGRWQGAFSAFIISACAPRYSFN